MPFYGSKRPGEEAEFQKQGWSEVIRYIRTTDPFHRMITIHPSRSARETVTDPAILDFDMHQTGHAPESAIGGMARQMSAAYAAKPTMPVIAGESSYDGLDLREFGGGVLSSDASRQMFWVGLMQNGAAGGTYGANGIWQVNRREQPYGPSPHGHSWGSIPWDVAMKRPGSTQVGLAKKFFARYPWFKLQPRPAGCDLGRQRASYRRHPALGCGNRGEAADRLCPPLSRRPRKATCARRRRIRRACSIPLPASRLRRGRSKPTGQETGSARRLPTNTIGWSSWRSRERVRLASSAAKTHQFPIDHGGSSWDSTTPYRFRALIINPRD